MSFCLQIEANLTIVSIFSYLGNPTVVSMSFCLIIKEYLTIVSILSSLGNPTVVSMSFCLMSYCLEIEANLLVV